MPSSPIERLVQWCEFLLARWRMILLPVLCAAPFAILGVKLSPVQYSASSIILLRSPQANGVSGGSQFPQQSAADQVKAVEAWLKSDPVLEQYLPQISDEPVSTDPNKLAALMRRTRAALKLTLVNNSVLEVQLDGANPNGLGRKLEIILTHLMEGLLKPGDGLLSGGQLILANRFDAWRNAEAALTDAIKATGIEPISAVVMHLSQLNATSFDADAAGNIKGEDGRLASAAAIDAASLDAVRQRLAKRPDTLQQLRELQIRTRTAHDTYAAAKSLFASDNRYAGVFDSPERLTLVGRPRDPLIGENPARKYGIAAMLLSLMAGFGIAFAAEIYDPRLRSRAQYESLSGLPVIARLPSYAPRFALSGEALDIQRT